MKDFLVLWAMCFANAVFICVFGWLHLRWMKSVHKRFEVTEKQTLKNIEIDIKIFEILKSISGGKAP